MAQEAWDIVGWRMYFQVAVQNGWFAETGKTPFDCVFYSDFTDFVDRISLLNAKV